MSQFQQGSEKISIVLPNFSFNFACMHMSVGGGGLNQGIKCVSYCKSQSKQFNKRSA